MKSSSIWIHGGWIDSRFFLWGEQPQGKGTGQNGFIYPFLVPPFELKLLLFQEDPDSFYGTFIETDRALLDAPLHNRLFQSPAGEATIYQANEGWDAFPFPVEGITLSIKQFIAYFPVFQTWKQKEPLHLGADFSAWLAIVESIYGFIRAGLVVPGQDGLWKLTINDAWFEDCFASLPKAALSLRSSQMANSDRQSDEIEHHATPLLKMLIDEAVRSLLSADNVSAAFTAWKQAVPQEMVPFLHSLETGRSKTVSPPSTLFAEQLGLKKAEPFQTALVLHDPPSPKESWSVSLSVADRNRPETLVGMEQLMAGSHPWRTNPVSRLKSDVLLISNHIPLLAGLSLGAPTKTMSAEEAYQLFTTYDRQLAEMGIQLIVPKWLKERSSLSVRLIGDHQTAQNGADPVLNWQDLANFQYTVSIGGQAVTEETFDQYVQENKPFLYVNGQWLAWDPTLAKQLKAYLEDINSRFTYLDAWKITKTQDVPEALSTVPFQLEWTDELEERLTALYKQQPEPVTMPSALKGTLRPYQKQGLDWLFHLRKVGFGGCLADDMGLGKSIQTIAYMLYVQEQQTEQQTAPFLLICPTSLLYNWADECKRFAPSLKVFIHHGQDRLEEGDARLAEADLVLTSYALALRDARFFKSVHWNGLILDEAQHIKNKNTKQRQAIRQLSATHRIALTGTPIENRLQELWSLMDLLNPSLLGSFAGFHKAYIRPIERDHDETKQQALQTLIRPFLLRRTKNDPATGLQLPNKRETTESVPLSLEQAALYQAVVEDVSERLATVAHLERKAMILRAITRMKQICNHPAQFYKDGDIAGHQSGKWDAFLDIVASIFSKGESVLIFTQYKEMGKLISHELQARYGVPVPFLHGGLSRSQRRMAIEQFQHDPHAAAFVLSLKAGGVGLNLTKATNVIHYDRWWNPAVENQATDRAYRIGQTKPVQVYKLLTAGTVEERIDQLINGKKALAEGVLQTPAFLTELNDDELLSLIQLSHTERSSE
ncbi:DEAD/DEAH box helicase [Bacillus sp. FSL W7-1282]